MGFIEAVDELFDDGGERRLVIGGEVGGRGGVCGFVGMDADGVDDFFGLGEQVVAAVFPGVGEGEFELGESGASVAIGGGEVGAGVEGLEGRGKPNRHRPPAGAGHKLRGEHVEFVEVWAFFAVDFDVDEVGIHDVGDVMFFEDFAFHDVAPVAGGVADGEEDGFVFAASFFDGFGAPGMPIDGVVGVLKEVGAGGVDETIGVFVENGGARRGRGMDTFHGA